MSENLIHLQVDRGKEEELAYADAAANPTKPINAQKEKERLLSVGVVAQIIFLVGMTVVFLPLSEGFM